jgi:alkylhydroperoxidase family enzyme
MFGATSHRVSHHCFIILFMEELRSRTQWRERSQCSSVFRSTVPTLHYPSLSLSAPPRPHHSGTQSQLMAITITNKNMGACISSKQERATATKSLNDDSFSNDDGAAAAVGGVYSSIPRMTPVAMDALPEKVRSSFDALPADSFKNIYAPVNVIGTIAKSPEVAASLLTHYVTLRKLMSLTNREKELVILRVAAHYRSEYVWKHHVVVGSEFGITKIECEALQQTLDHHSTNTTTATATTNIATVTDTFSDRECALIAMADDLVVNRTIANSTWQRCNAFFEESEIIDIVLLLSHYVFFSLVNNSLCVEVEPSLNDIPGLVANYSSSAVP